ncbi:hypothetical protein L596_017425 [Steinernema carpocapsae]|uniref:Uncharacterized protein n=1 Tax=Steinernema carpocapsae TaxID=34508 RepID=A0A4U5N1V9_STECR|nr:hypothetical protein L596_017425 [Steinernema carpocapsae]
MFQPRRVAAHFGADANSAEQPPMLRRCPSGARKKIRQRREEQQVVVGMWCLISAFDGCVIEACGQASYAIGININIGQFFVKSNPRSSLLRQTSPATPLPRSPPLPSQNSRNSTTVVFSILVAIDPYYLTTIIRNLSLDLLHL